MMNTRVGGMVLAMSLLANSTGITFAPVTPVPNASKSFTKFDERLLEAAEVKRARKAGPR